MPESPPAEPKSELDTLLAAATDHENLVIRDVAIRAGLRWHCPCGWLNPGTDQRCGECHVRRISADEPRHPDAIKLAAVRDYLNRAHRDGDARFVDACRTSLCGMAAADAADEVFLSATHYGYARAWSVLADEIIADVETTANTREVSG